MLRVVEPAAMLVALAIAVLGFIIGLVLGLARGEGSRAAYRGLEAAGLALLGGIVARLFINIPLLLGGDSPGASLVVGWAFFLWPGVVDTIAAPFGARLLSTPDRLLWIALFVGSFAGMMDGMRRIHRWRGDGALSFLLDVTWGLAGTTNALLLHLVNFAWAEHTDEARQSCHRYRKGFQFKSGFAFTQGNAMSAMGHHAPGTPLHRHEMVHVWQNRAFGPLFTLAYLGWMVVFFIPALIAGLATPAGPALAIERWCYTNNPFEAWAYLVGHRHGASARSGELVWSDGAVMAASAVFFTGFLALTAVLVAVVWL
jgi:hypothetical protein